MRKGKQLEALFFGRAQENSVMTIEKWKKIIAYKKELKGIPIIANADFGHTTPIFTFPIGGKAILKAKDNKIELRIREE